MQNLSQSGMRLVVANFLPVNCPSENSLPVNFTGNYTVLNNSELSANKVDHFYGS